MNMLELTVKAEYTPNPNSIKFVCNEALYPAGTLTYSSVEEAEANPLAKKLFTVNGVVKIFIMSNFVTVDKNEDTNWKDIHLEIKQFIKDEIGNLHKWAEENAPQLSQASTSDDSESRTRIEEVLDKLRPALVADGGNIELVDIVEKDVRLRMVGACGSCPSAMMTMKMGVERALVSELPDLVETVTQVY